eukprot:CAMPEP_0119547920 /NCGR_PEP_ID=MMETSP1352-20130426/1932_1 /TAXON_ID=265584 /ORGANISM="Stauroneis constricta, Strain CCMP1120" /LENGTH=424 /DNA_ID=CAMNT_0007592999 /DNA_START=107 /DNA_END=1379 /DNA_ORIENTATION=+
MFLIQKKEVLAMAIANTVLFGSVDAFLSGKKPAPEQVERAAAVAGGVDNKSGAHDSTTAAANLRAAPHHHAAVTTSLQEEGRTSPPTLETMDKDAAAASAKHDSGVIVDSPSVDLHAQVSPLTMKGTFPQKKTIRRRAKSSKASKAGGGGSISSKKGGCFTGTGEEVTAACKLAGADCCCSDPSLCEYRNAVGDRYLPCDWEYDVTVCSGSCNGEGACFESEYYLIPDGTVIEEDSCNGIYACYDVLGSVAKKSCNGVDACAFRTEDTEDDSCNGYFACFSSDGKIDKNSCNSRRACISSTADIEDDSCNGYFACFSSSGKIDKKSCNGLSACNYNENNIGEESCNAGGSCFRNKGNIGDESCNAQEACYKNTRNIGSKKCNSPNAVALECAPATAMTSPAAMLPLWADCGPDAAASLRPSSNE